MQNMKLYWKTNCAFVCQIKRKHLVGLEKRIHIIYFNYIVLNTYQFFFFKTVDILSKNVSGETHFYFCILGKRGHHKDRCVCFTLEVLAEIFIPPHWNWCKMNPFSPTESLLKFHCMSERPYTCHFIQVNSEVTCQHRNDVLSPNYTTTCVRLLKMEVQLTNAYRHLDIVASIKDKLRNRTMWRYT